MFVSKRHLIFCQDLKSFNPFKSPGTDCQSNEVFPDETETLPTHHFVIVSTHNTGSMIIDKQLVSQKNERQ